MLTDVQFPHSIEGCDSRICSDRASHSPDKFGADLLNRRTYCAVAYKRGNLPAFCHKATPGEPAKTEPGVSPRTSPKLVAIFTSEEVAKLGILPKHGAADTVRG